MLTTVSGVLDLMDGIRSRVVDPACRIGDPQQRASALAAGLRTLWPHSLLYACRLPGKVAHAAALDAQGVERTEWVALAQRGPQALTPESAHLGGQQLLCNPVGQGSATSGFLALSVPADADAELSDCVKALLAAGARELDLLLRLEASEEARAAQTLLADFGELAGPLAHEFNNLVNNLVLHAAVLEHQVSAEVAAEMRELRRQGTQVASLVRHFQETRRSGSVTTPTSDLNDAVRAVAAAASWGDGIRTYVPPAAAPGPTAVPVEVDLAPDLVFVPLTVGDLERLVRFLTRNAVRSAFSNGGRVWLRTAGGQSRLFLTVEDSGPDVRTEELNHVFEPTARSRDGASGLELAACRSIVRRAGGRLQARARPGGGLIVIADLPAGLA
jgi:signal transduction histidine kinase